MGNFWVVVGSTDRVVVLFGSERLLVSPMELFGSSSIVAKFFLIVQNVDCAILYSMRVSQLKTFKITLFSQIRKYSNEIRLQIKNSMFVCKYELKMATVVYQQFLFKQLGYSSLR